MLWFRLAIYQFRDSDFEKALEHAWDIGDAGVVLLSMDRFLDPIRDQPQFKVLLE